MGLSQSANIALSGLRATQLGIEVVSRNVANADTEGYTKKTLSLSNKASDGNGYGVDIGAVTRQVDQFLQTSVRSSYSDFNELNVQTEYLTTLDNLFGQLGGDTALDTIVNNVSEALVEFANSPQLDSARQGVIESADYLASHLNDMSSQIQDMRQNVELSIADEVESANQAMENIAQINYQLSMNVTSDVTADLLDQLDNNIDDLAAIMDVQVVKGANNTVSVFTGSGILLVNQTANTLEFDANYNINATDEYSLADSERGVGTISLVSSNGSSIDLLQQDAIKSGKLAGLIELRDETLAEAQDELDELAHGLAQMFSTQSVEGTDVTSGANEGLQLDLTGLQDGNVVEFEYKDNVTGVSHTISFVKVEDASLLPLANDTTAIANDTVYGIDFSGGMASVTAQITAAISAENPNFTVSLVGGTDIQILDDGAGGLVDVVGLTAAQSVTGTQGQGTSLNLFTDQDETGEVNYTNSLEDGGQKSGFAARITINSDLLDDNTLLVKYETGTAIGDQTRAEDLLEKFTETEFTFSANSGIGSTNSPFTGSLDAFARQVVSDQTSKIEKHEGVLESAELILTTLVGQVASDSSVDVDEEMANLLILQTAYSANARIVTVVKELMELIMNM